MDSFLVIFNQNCSTTYDFAEALEFTQGLASFSDNVAIAFTNPKEQIDVKTSPSFVKDHTVIYPALEMFGINKIYVLDKCDTKLTVTLISDEEFINLKEEYQAVINV